MSYQSTKGYIFHIIPALEWKEVQKKPFYAPASLSSDGFIHCSMANQLLESANAFFAGQKGLLLLVIDTNAVQAHIDYEANGFPHIHGPLEIKSVIKTIPFEPLSDGVFALPPELK